MHCSFPVGCVDTFETINNMNALGGIKVTDSSVNTDDECKQYCLDRSFSNCAGIDFNDVTDECFVHESPNNYASSNRHTNNAVTLFIRKKCGNYGILLLCHIAFLTSNDFNYFLF